MNFIESNTIASNEDKGIVIDNVKVDVKIEDFLMDDLNLSTQFFFQFNEGIKDVVNLDNLHNIELTDLIIKDEENRIIYNTSDKETFEKYCKENNLNYVFGEFNENYMNNGLNCFPSYHSKEGNYAKLTYNMYTDGYPKSKTLYFTFRKILITENENAEGNVNKVTLTGDWNIKIDVPEKMYNRTTEYYKVISCDNKDFNVYTATVSNTGFEIGITISNIKKPERSQILKDLWKKYENGEITIDEYNRKINEEKEFKDAWLEYLKQINPITRVLEVSEQSDAQKENITYVENEYGKKFECTMSPSRRQNSNFIDGNKFDFYETFGMTKYDATDKIKVMLSYYEELVTIELEKVKK